VLAPGITDNGNKGAMLAPGITDNGNKGAVLAPGITAHYCQHLLVHHTW
jgi:hypothetical protein